jgi:signal transduction histidine kinase
VAVFEFFANHPAKRDERFMEVMPDVGMQLGHVFERKRLDRRVADATEQEQRRIGQDIHDGIGQELTGLKYLAQTQAETLEESHPKEAELAHRIATGFETIQLQLRRLIRDLVPVEVDRDGLVSALQSLAIRTADDYDLMCDLSCDDGIAIDDSLVATHMYRIAQEAVSNSVKHANPTQIWIELEAIDSHLALRVGDNGVGMNEPPRSSDAFGIRSMTYRAEFLGGRLRISQRKDGGTQVVCTVPWNRSR